MRCCDLEMCSLGVYCKTIIRVRLTCSLAGWLAHSFATQSCTALHCTAPHSLSTAGRRLRLPLRRCPLKLPPRCCCCRLCAAVFPPREPSQCTHFCLLPSLRLCEREPIAAAAAAVEKKVADTHNTADEREFYAKQT